jgi:hypothetical protein
MNRDTILLFGRPINTFNPLMGTVLVWIHCTFGGWRRPISRHVSAIVAIVSLLIGTNAFGQTGPQPESLSSLEPAKFSTPEQQYRPIDCWWWDGAPLNRERLRFQIEDMHAKGVGGTWLYPRFHHSQPMSSDPGFWTDGWWQFVKFALDEHERVGMVQWANDWIGRYDKNYFQNQLMGERDQNPALIGHRLVYHREDSTAPGTVKVVVPQDQTIITASAYKRSSKDTASVDGESRIELANAIFGHEVRWDAPSKGWSVIVVASEPHGLNYIGPEVAKRWNEVVFEKYEQKLRDRLGRSLVAYGPDERFVLNGNILYSDALRLQITRKKGYDPLPDLPALFVDIGPRTDKVRCEYYDVMVLALEDNFYKPVTEWLHEHDMQQATIATWGRENLLGQVFNYGDFFRMMRHFDVTGNEDSAESGAGAFIDSKLSSSIAHLNGKPRVAVCGYWGTGWGFTQEQNLARTNINYALGTNLMNTHGVLYSFMGGRNEFVPPESHFYQPYWQTWRTFYDYLTRLSYVLSQGNHRADVAIVYPISTLHAQWYGGSKFGRPARDAQQSMFGLAKAIYNGCAIDFDFIDEASVAKAKYADGKLKPAKLEFSAVVLPQMSTIRTDAAMRLKEFVEDGGTLLVFGSPPTASTDRGRDDENLRQIWQELLGDYGADDEAIVQKQHKSGGRAILARASEAAAAAALRNAIKPDVQLSEPDVIHTHQQVAKQHVYFFVNRRAEKRSIEAIVRARGIPEIWDANTGEIQPLYRYQLREDGTRLRLEIGPNAGVLLVIQPTGERPEVVDDNLTTVDEIRADRDNLVVIGTQSSNDIPFAKLAAGGKVFIGRGEKVTPPKALELDGLWDCEYHPTMNNRWGDFRYPASNDYIGPEMPRMKYRAEPNGLSRRPDWQATSIADEDWREVNCTFGPYWQVLGPFDERLDSRHETDLVAAAKIGDESIAVGSKQLSWQPYGYSQKLGAERRDVHQSLDGMGPVSPDFLVFDRPSSGKAAVCYLRTQVVSPRDQKLYLHFGNTGDVAPRKAWINGECVINVEVAKAGSVAKVTLRKGANDVVLRLGIPVVTAQSRKRHGPESERVATTPSVTSQRVATFAVFLDSPEAPEPPRYLPISRWYQTTADLICDYLPADDNSIGWYRFPAPPGTRSARLSLVAESMEAWVNGELCEIVDGVLKFPTAVVADGQASQVALRVKHRRGCYEGAAFREPVAFDCGIGKIALGDWCNSGLQYYSGGVTYSKKVQLAEEQIANNVLLDLGDVRTSAEVTVNGQPLGTRLARPFVFDLSKAVRAGENEIQVKVLNTLANYMSAQQTRFVFKDQTISGLLGPTNIKFISRVKVHCLPTSTDPQRNLN